MDKLTKICLLHAQEVYNIALERHYRLASGKITAWDRLGSKKQKKLKDKVKGLK
jgi:hypothetical protein